MNTPRIEVDLDHVGHNARVLVERAGARGIGVTGVTKAFRGHPAIAETLVRAGVVALGDARVENLERLRDSGIRAPRLLLRSPLPAAAACVVAAADTSCNTELEVVERLAVAAVVARRVHGVVLMVELGDLREGIMVADVPHAVARCLALPGIQLAGIGANLACRSGVAPDDRNMAVLSDLAEAIERRFGVELAVVSGGNSANLEWLRTTADVGRINDLRLGEAILLGTDPLRGMPVDGLHHDAVRVVASVIESKRKPRSAWGERALTPFASVPGTVAQATESDGYGWQAVIALGHLDTDPAALAPPPGTTVVGASSDHLVVTSEERFEVGAEVTFVPGYSAMARAMASPYVHQRLLVAPVPSGATASAPGNPAGRASMCGPRPPPVGVRRPR